LAGGVPGQRWWWRESKESNAPPSHPECKKTAKNGLFPTLIDLKIAQNAVFYSKILNDILLRRFLRKTSILTIFVT
jgi:hypothetical protein